MAGEKILIADDERHIRTALKMAFLREGMKVTEASCGKETLDQLHRSSFDLLILDIMMEDMDGFSILTRLRSEGDMTPVLILSGKKEDTDQVLGLGLGADDYLTKPFHLPVLIQKVKALIRRNQVYSQEKSLNCISYGPFTLNLLKLECYKNQTFVPFTPKEFLLFRFFLEHPGQVFTKKQIYQQVWSENVVDDNTVMVFMKRVRSKIEDDPKNPVFLRTIRGIGYVFGEHV